MALEVRPVLGDVHRPLQNLVLEDVDSLLGGEASSGGNN